MLKTELLEIIANRENSGVEFKRDDIRPEQLAKEIVAMLNFQGGRVLLGVEDDGSISGLQRENSEEWVMNVLRDKIRITTLQKMLSISAYNPETIESLFRNNRGHAGLVVATFIKSYLKLLVLEARHASKRWQLKYFVAVICGTLRLPVQFLSGLRFLLESRKVGK